LRRRVEYPSFAGSWWGCGSYWRCITSPALGDNQLPYLQIDKKLTHTERKLTINKERRGKKKKRKKEKKKKKKKKKKKATSHGTCRFVGNKIQEINGKTK
jgi:hypothetical protein